MRFLLTNDDGFDAPGLQALRLAASSLGEYWIVAPTSAMSGCGHRVTTDSPLLVRSWQKNCWHVDGTPADCVRIAIAALKLSFDWVLSGVNAGGNLGADAYISGTVAAAREAALHGIPSIALSQYRKRGLDLDWQMSSTYAKLALEGVLTRPANRGEYWNVNFPHLPPGSDLPGLVVCPADTHSLPVQFEPVETAESPAFLYRGEYAQRQRDPGTDVACCFAGHIAVCKLTL